MKNPNSVWVCLFPKNIFIFWNLGLFTVLVVVFFCFAMKVIISQKYKIKVIEVNLQNKFRDVNY